MAKLEDALDRRRAACLVAAQRVVSPTQPASLSLAFLERRLQSILTKPKKPQGLEE